MSSRHEFVTLASQAEANVRELCRRYRISSRTAYKWLSRFRADGVTGLADRSRRPNHTPERTPPAVEERVIALRREHPAWGGRKLHARLRALGVSAAPSPSTITAILRRHGMLDPTKSSEHRPWQRFEHAEPNDLWQMDFKGHIPTESGRCHPPDYPGRPLPLLPRPPSVWGRTRGHGARAADPHLPPLWSATSYPRGQRRALGRPRWPTLHSVLRLAVAVEHRCQSWPGLPSADSRYRRTLPPYPGG